MRRRLWAKARASAGQGFSGGFGVFVPISWLSLNYSWGLAGILIGLSALMLWRGATNVYRFTGRKWTAGTL